MADYLPCEDASAETNLIRMQMAQVSSMSSRHDRLEIRLPQEVYSPLWACVLADSDYDQYH